MLDKTGCLWSVMVPSRMRKVVFTSVFLSTAMLGTLGCDAHDRGVVNPRARLDNSGAGGGSADRLTSASKTRGIEDEFLRIEHEIPGFGGFYLTSVGSDTITAYLQDLAYEDAARTKIQELIQRHRPNQVNPFHHVNEIQIVHGHHAFSQLVRWQQQLSSVSSQIKDFAWIDADEVRNQVSVGVITQIGGEDVLAAARHLGIPGEALNIELSERAVFANLDGTWRPTGGGVRIVTEGSLCSLGYNVSGITGGTGTHLITAAHCVNLSLGTTGAVGSEVYQPNPWDSLGAVVTNPPWTATHPDCTGYVYCVESDAMLVDYRPGVIGNKQVKITGSLGSTTVAGAWNVVAWISPAVNVSLDRMGRTTGWRRGTVTNTCVNNVVLAPPPFGSVMNLCNDRVGAVASGGDSGGTVFTSTGSGTASIAGIVSSAATSFYHLTNWGRINNVLGFMLPY